MSDSPEPQTTEEADAAFEDVLEDVGTEPTEGEVTEEVTDATPEDGDQLPTRDEQGRFAKAEGTELPEDAPAPESPDEPEAEVVAPTFRYQAEGREIEIPGSAQGDKGIFVPTEQLPNLTRQLRESEAFRGSYQRTLGQKDRERQQIVTERDAIQEELQTYRDKIRELVTNDQAFEQFIGELRTNWSTLEAQAESAKNAKLLEKERSERETWERDKHDQELRPVMYGRLDQGVRAIGKELSLPDHVLKATYGRMAGDLDRYFPVAQQDDVQVGVKKGERYDLDIRAVRNELAYLRDVIGTQKAPEPQQSQKPGNKPPPTVPAKRGPAPPGKKKPDFSKADDPTAAVDEWFENM